MNKDILLRHDEAFEESLEKIFEWFDEKMYFKIKDELLKYNEADIAEMFEEFLEEEDLRSRTVVVYRLLPKDISVDVFAYLPSDDQLKIVEGITDAEIATGANGILTEGIFAPDGQPLAALVSAVRIDTTKTEVALV